MTNLISSLYTIDVGIFLRHMNILTGAQQSSTHSQAFTSYLHTDSSTSISHRSNDESKRCFCSHEMRTELMLTLWTWVYVNVLDADSTE